MREPSDRSSDRSVVRRTLGLGVLASLFAVLSRGLAHAADALTISANGEVGIDKLSCGGIWRWPARPRSLPRTHSNSGPKSPARKLSCRRNWLSNVHEGRT